MAGEKALGVFELSELCTRYKRNLLFVAMAANVHFFYASLSDVQVLNTKLPAELLVMLLTVCVIWFAINYGVQLNGEYIKWRSEHMMVFSSIGFNHTLIPAVAVMRDKQNYKVKELTWTIKLGIDADRAEALNIETLDCVESTQKNQVNEILDILRMDSQRIKSFEDCVNKHGRYSRYRFIALDVIAPAVVTGLAITGVVINIAQFHAPYLFK